MHVRRGRLSRRTRSSSSETPRRQVPVDLPRRAARGDPRRDRHDRRRVPRRSATASRTSELFGDDRRRAGRDDATAASTKINDDNVDNDELTTSTAKRERVTSRSSTTGCATSTRSRVRSRSWRAPLVVTDESEASRRGPIASCCPASARSRRRCATCASTGLDRGARRRRRQAPACRSSASASACSCSRRRATRAARRRARLDRRRRRALRARARTTRVPHVGWNEVRVRARLAAVRRHPARCRLLLRALAIHVVPARPRRRRAHHARTAAASSRRCERGHVFGVQFHPEKSQQPGSGCSRNFLAVVTAVLKIRVMPTLLHKDFGLVKGVRFDSWRRVGAGCRRSRSTTCATSTSSVFSTSPRAGTAPSRLRARRRARRRVLHAAHRRRRHRTGRRRARPADGGRRQGCRVLGRGLEHPSS